MRSESINAFSAVLSTEGRVVGLCCPTLRSPFRRSPRAVCTVRLVLEILCCDPKGHRALLRVPTTEGRGARLCWALSKPTGLKGATTLRQAECILGLHTYIIGSRSRDGLFVVCPPHYNLVAKLYSYCKKLCTEFLNLWVFRALCLHDCLAHKKMPTPLGPP